MPAVTKPTDEDYQRLLELRTGLRRFLRWSESQAEAAGLVERGPDPHSLSVVRLHLTDKGSAHLEALSEQHLQELAHLAPTMHALWDALEHADGAAHPAARPRE